MEIISLGGSRCALCGACVGGGRWAAALVGEGRGVVGEGRGVVGEMAVRGPWGEGP